MHGLLQLDVPRIPVKTLKSIVAHLCVGSGAGMSRVTMRQVCQAHSCIDMWGVCHMRKTECSSLIPAPGSIMHQKVNPDHRQVCR